VDQRLFTAHEKRRLGVASGHGMFVFGLRE
jgi:hypothetical protein